MNKNQIFLRLKKIRENAIAPYSKFRVGALLKSSSGKFYSGHNIESSSYGLTICAERVALFKALSEGERQFSEIHILADGDDFCPPCGACRQLLMDFTPDINILLYNKNGQSKHFKISDLLPQAFTPTQLLKVIK
jgi:cytidine deaminase